MQITPEQNKELVIEAFDVLLNRRDYANAETCWFDHYIQHSAHILVGREGLFSLLRSTPSSLRYEHQLVMAQGANVFLHRGSIELPREH